jgi:hypothetical protein
MKYIAAVLMLILWFITTCILVFSIVGLIVLILFGDEWMDISKRISKTLEN